MAYIALTKVQHNGEFFEIGDEVTAKLEKKEIERLLEAEAIEDDGKKIPAAKEDKVTDK